MQNEYIWAECRHTVGKLLQAIESDDLSAIERQLGALNQSLSQREDYPGRPYQGDESLRAEQLDAIDGLSEAIRRSLRSMTVSARAEMDRIRAAGPLLRHLVAAQARFN